VLQRNRRSRPRWLGDRDRHEPACGAHWCAAKGIKILYIQPGKPDQNAIIERFNRSFRREVLDAHIFESLIDAREIAESWLRRYNEIRPHDSLGSLPPAKYREKIIAESSKELST
jgi:putative transposase